MTTSSRGDEPVLVSVDLETKRQRWQRGGFGVTGVNRFALWKLLHVARDVMPIFRKAEVDSENSFTRVMGEIVVEIIDKRTGATVGPVVSTGHSASQKEQLTGGFGLWPGYFVIATRSGIVSLKTTGELSGGPAQGLSEGRQP